MRLFQLLRRIFGFAANKDGADGLHRQRIRDRARPARAAAEAARAQAAELRRRAEEDRGAS